MRTTQWMKLTAIVSLVFLLVAAAGGCVVPPTVPPEPPAELETISEPGEAATVRPVEEEEPFVPDQVIITGPRMQVETLIAEAQTRLQVELEPAAVEPSYRLNLGEVDIRLRECEDVSALFEDLLLGDCHDDQDGWVMDLYQIKDPPETQVRDVVEGINRLSRDSGLCTYADPNYLTGSPHTVDGSPHTVDGSPYTVYHDTATVSEFEEQWALDQIDLCTGGQRSILDVTGQGVRVSVFDTSPYKQPGTQTIGLNTVDCIDPTFTLAVSHPTIYDSITLPPPPLDPSATQLPDLSDHGLAVAGLVHAVAPNSEIHLIRGQKVMLDRDIAFALIKTEKLDDKDRTRITREAQAMGRLGSHQNIVTVFDLGLGGISNCIPG